MANNQDTLHDMISNGVQFQKVGAFEYASANDVLFAASLEPLPQPLWMDGMIYEKEVTVIFSDTNTGKSVLAVQIAEDIARQGKTVVYIDFELSNAQFLMRYSNENGELKEFSENFKRVTLSPYEPFEQDDSIPNILSLCTETGAEVIIIDNLTWLDRNTEQGDAAALLMQELVKLKRMHGRTVIAISHTPKRYLDRPITENDLSGSKKMANFFDAMVAIGRCVIDPNLRYIKQVKNRNTITKYGADNVLVCELNKGEQGNFLHFEILRTADESDLLQSADFNTREYRMEQIKNLTAQGLSQRHIAKELGVSKTCVQNAQKRIENDTNKD